MAKPIKFTFAGEKSVFEMHKVDRSRLYGYKELEVLDENGNACVLTTLAKDGQSLIGKGGTGIGYVDADGNWCDKDQMKPVDLQGNKITPVASSFAAPIELSEEASTERFLDHNIRLIYELDPEGITPELAKRLQAGAMFMFPYSYRGGLEADTGFLMTNAAGDIFFLVGDDSNIEFKSLQQVVPVTDYEANDDDASLMDFDMI
ncbi:hypothetical protein N9Y42_09220 [Mariniblastus sp.]|nr:hypothetical protein [Mariniblastus sp.]